MMISKFFTKSMLSSLFLSLALGLSGCGQNPGEPPTLPECGNGTLEDGEQCDDGDNLSGDGCSSSCDLEEEDECGDGTLNAGEGCDDGNQISGDGCSSGCDIEGPSEAEQIDEYVQGIGELPPVEENRVEGVEAPFDSGDDNYECTTQSVTETQALSEVAILQNGTTFIFPGAILRGDSLSGGGFTETAFERTPMTYSLSVLDGGSGPRSATMQNPSLSEFRDTIGVVLSQADLGNVPVSANVKITEIKSETELDFALGLGVNSPQLDVKANFDFNSQEIRSHYLLTIDSAFFTADVDAIINPSDVFAPSVTLEEMQQKFSDGNPPVYISSITYGTRIYVAIESQFDSTEVGAALEASFNNGPITVDGNTSLGFKEVLQSSSFNLVALGASSSQLSGLTSALASADPIAGVKAFLQSPTLFSAANIGVPVSFQMKYLADNQQAAFGFAGSFDVVACVRVSQNIQVQLDSIAVSSINDDGTGESNTALELFGTINVCSLDSLGNCGNIFDLTTASARSVGPSPVSFGQAQNRTILQIKPEEQKNLRVVVNLGDEDNVGSAENIINLSPTIYPFTAGFNLTDTLIFGTNQGEVAITLTMKPVF